jgi:RNA polymerase sigma factor (sigma-70 family)
MNSPTTMQGDFVARLCREYESQLQSYLTQMVGSPETARELVKDSFDRVRIYMPERAAFPRAVLFKVATNVALMHLRQRRAAQVGVTPPMHVAEAREVLRCGSGPEDQDRAEQLGQYLANAIKALRPSHRKVFIMAHIKGMPRKDIAAALGISEARVDSRMTKALKRARDYLTAHGIDFSDVIGLVAVLPIACMLIAH